MKRIAGACAVAWLAASTSSGCAREQEALIVLNSIAPTAMADSDQCEYSIDSDVFRSSGRMDVSAGDSYILAPILQNNLPSRTADSNNSSVDDSELQLLDTVDITLNLPSDVAADMAPGPDGDRLPLSYPVYVATDSLSPGQRYAAVVEIVPAEYSEALAAAVEPGRDVQMSVDIQFHATRTGNTRGNVGVIDARLYSFPIELCNGCMVRFCECEGDRCAPGSDVQFYTQCGTVQDFYGDPFCEEGSTISGGSSSTGAPQVGTTGNDSSETIDPTMAGATDETSDGSFTDGPPPPGGSTTMIPS